MKITLYSTHCFTEIGGRNNNEDNLYPPIGESTVNDRLFLVCDGVGGHHGGEFASEYACKYISLYFKQHPKSVIDSEYIENAISYGREAIKDEQKKQGIDGMATTLTLLYFGNEGVTFTHLGDSRIYQLRGGKIIRQTEDHSFVNSLVKAGMITKEAAQNHPRRNQITRCLSTNVDEAEIQLVKDIQAGDYFFMCTDGVLEQLSHDELLEYYLYNESFNSNAERLEAIREECYGNTRDNFTAYLIQIESVEQEVQNHYSLYHSPPPLEEEVFIQPRKRKQKSYLLPIIASLVFFIMAGAVGYWWWKYKPNNTEKYKTLLAKTPTTPPIHKDESPALIQRIPEKVKNLALQKITEESTANIVEVIPFGKDIKLEVIGNGRAKRKLSNGKYDEGIYKKGDGYVYYKADIETLYVLFIKKTGGKYFIQEIPEKGSNDDELKIKNKGKTSYEIVNLKTGEIKIISTSVKSETQGEELIKSGEQQGEPTKNKP